MRSNYVASIKNIPQTDLLKLPSNARVFLSTVTGDKSTITEKDFGGEDLSKLKELVTNKIKAQNGRQHGDLNYGDYLTYGGEDQSKLLSEDQGYNFISRSKEDPNFRLKTTIGRAKFEVNRDGDIIVHDKYNFAEGDATNEEIHKFGGLKTALAYLSHGNPYRALHILGTLSQPEDSGKGREVKINLGKLE